MLLITFCANTGRSARIATMIDANAISWARWGLKLWAFWLLWAEQVELIVPMVYCLEEMRYMGEKQLEQEESEHSEEIFKKMYHALYEYYFSCIGFLDLLNKWEEILISS